MYVCTVHTHILIIDLPSSYSYNEVSYYLGSDLASSFIRFFPLAEWACQNVPVQTNDLQSNSMMMIFMTDDISIDSYDN